MFIKFPRDEISTASLRIFEPIGGFFSQYTVKLAIPYCENNDNIPS